MDRVFAPIRPTQKVDAASKRAATRLVKRQEKRIGLEDVARILDMLGLGDDS